MIRERSYAFQAVLYSTDSTHMVCVIVSSIAAISSVAKSIREVISVPCFKLWLQQARFSCIFHRWLWFIWEDIKIVATFYGLDGHNFDLYRCVDSFVGLF